MRATRFSTAEPLRGGLALPAAPYPPDLDLCTPLASPLTAFVVPGRRGGWPGNRRAAEAKLGAGARLGDYRAFNMPRRCWCFRRWERVWERAVP